MNKAKLVFIPSPGIGHLVSIFELAKCFLDRDDRFSITFLIIKPPSGQSIIETYAQSIFNSDTRLEYIALPHATLPPSIDPLKSFENFLSVFMDCHKPHVKHAILNQVMSNNSAPLAGLVVDVMCSSMIDVGKELGVPSYVFFPPCNATLGLLLYIAVRHDQVAGKEFDETDPEYNIPSYINPIPCRVLQSCLFNQHGGYTSFVNHSRNVRAAKRIIVNSFIELEPYAINSFKVFNDAPPVYNVGPLLDLKGLLGQTGSTSNYRTKHDQIISWLDAQASESVVFLCFGSMGSFREPQLQEIAIALERSGHRFLWSVRRSSPKDKFEWPGEYTDYHFLPEGFLNRTKNVGLICGWVPQLEVLGHRAVGAFVSHCGWNSILESLWHGVPIVTWPMYCEQQTNAFEMVKDLGLAVELKLDYRVESSGIVMADEIERSVACVMDPNCEVRNKVKAMSERSRQAVMKGGSSYAQIESLIEDILANKGLKIY